MERHAIRARFHQSSKSAQAHVIVTPRGMIQPFAVVPPLLSNDATPFGDVRLGGSKIIHRSQS